MKEMFNQMISLTLPERLVQIFKESADREKLGGNNGVHLVVKHDPPSENTPNL